MPSEPVIVYIVGAGRSGSTLLERMLGSLNGFHNVGELVEVYHRGIIVDEQCSCGHAFSTCEFWQQVGQKAFGGWTMDQAKALDKLRWQVQPRKRLANTFADTRRHRGPVTEYAAAFAPIPRAVASVTGADVIVDASKLVTQAIALHSSPELDVRFLHLVRDPRGVAYSWTKTGVARPTTDTVFTEMRTHSPAVSAGRWAVDNTLAEAFGRSTEHYHRMRYEDLIADPAGEVGKALVGLGLTPPPELVSRLSGTTLDLESGHALLGNPSGYGSSRVKLREDTGWITGLSQRDKRVVTAMTMPMLMRYRYPVRTTSKTASTAGTPGQEKQ